MIWWRNLRDEKWTGRFFRKNSKNQISARKLSDSWGYQTNSFENRSESERTDSRPNAPAAAVFQFWNPIGWNSIAVCKHFWLNNNHNIGRTDTLKCNITNRAPDLIGKVAFSLLANNVLAIVNNNLLPKQGSKLWSFYLNSLKHVDEIFFLNCSQTCHD